MNKDSNEYIFKCYESQNDNRTLKQTLLLSPRIIAPVIFLFHIGLHAFKI